MRSHFDKGLAITFERISDEIGIHTIEAYEVYSQLSKLGLIDRARVQEVFTEIGKSND